MSCAGLIVAGTLRALSIEPRAIDDVGEILTRRKGSQYPRADRGSVVTAAFSLSLVPRHRCDRRGYAHVPRMQLPPGACSDQAAVAPRGTRRPVPFRHTSGIHWCRKSTC